ncbi:MAG TPA: outer membrane protein transport protein [Verrucomicrobiae bacterium]
MTNNAIDLRLTGVRRWLYVRGAPAVLLLSIAPLWLVGNNATALGVRIPNQDAFAIARANAFAATADNPSAIYYNPAGITQLDGQNVQLGSLFYLGIYADYESPSGVSVHNEAEVLPAPTLYYTYTPKDLPFSFGLGVYEPFGFSVKWPETAPFRNEAIEGSLSYVTINPVAAWKVAPTLSLSVGPTFNYSEMKLRQGAAVPVPGAELEFSGHNWSYGFNGGILWQPHPKWSLGASYRSASRMNYEGSASLYPSPPLPSLGSTSARFDYPQIVIGGVSYRPNTNWNIEVNVDWADWSSVQNLTIKGVANRELDWESSFMYEVGVTRNLWRGYYLGLGYFYSQSSTPNRLYTPLVADTDLHIGSLGAGYKGARWSWGVALQLIGGTWRNVVVDSTAVDPQVNGKYRLFTPTLSFSLGYRF